MGREIVVEYDGSYPSTCMGNLKITVDEKEIYNESCCCRSTGTVWFDEDWDEHVESGKLIWEDAWKFEKDIQEAVAEKLQNYAVCCGGCI